MTVLQPPNRQHQASLGAPWSFPSCMEAKPLPGVAYRIVTSAVRTNTNQILGFYTELIHKATCDTVTPISCVHTEMGYDCPTMGEPIQQVAHQTVLRIKRDNDMPPESIIIEGTIGEEAQRASVGMSQCLHRRKVWGGLINRFDLHQRASR